MVNVFIGTVVSHPTNGFLLTFGAGLSMCESLQHRNLIGGERQRGREQHHLLMLVADDYGSFTDTLNTDV